jgi:hypothetical protein
MGSIAQTDDSRTPERISCASTLLDRQTVEARVSAIKVESPAVSFDELLSGR